MMKCGECGRSLTDPFSIRLGIGPECRSKLGKKGWKFPKPRYQVRAGHVEFLGMVGKIQPPTKPLAWIGHDRILLNDTTSLGVRRKVIARKDDVPNVVGLLQVAFDEARSAKVHWWLVQKADGFVYLWIVWRK